MCKYKDIFGKPKTGVHKIRLFNIAFIDFIFTLLGALVISLFTSFSSKPFVNFVIVAFFLFLLGIILHRLFCVRTTIDKFLFPSL